MQPRGTVKSELLMRPTRKLWLGLLTGIAAVTAINSEASTQQRPLVHAPIFVGRPPGHRGIMPYVFNYHGHYSYNSPGPVFYRLNYRGPHMGCWLWRYNYLNWIC
jgi:hypothetical protein